MPAINARPHNEPEPDYILARRAAWSKDHARGTTQALPLTESTAIDDVNIIHADKYHIDIVAGRKLIGGHASGDDIERHCRNLVRLPVDPGFWATLRGSERAAYLAGRTVGGVRYGRVLLHTLADGRTFLTLPCTPGDHGYRVIPIAEVRRGLDDGVWREV